MCVPPERVKQETFFVCFGKIRDNDTSIRASHGSMMSVALCGESRPQLMT